MHFDRCGATLQDQSINVNKSHAFFSAMRNKSPKMFRYLGMKGRGRHDKGYLEHLSEVNSIRFKMVYKVDEIGYTACRLKLLEGGMTNLQARDYLSRGIYGNYTYARFNTVKYDFIAKKMVLNG